MKSYNSITYRYLKHQKKRSILTVVGIILSVALLTAIFTMMVSLRDKMIKDAIKNNGDYHGKFVNVPADKVNKLAYNVDVKSYGVAENEGTAVINTLSEEEIKLNPKISKYNYLIISGYDEEAFKSRGIQIKEGRLPESPDELAIDITSLDSFKSTPKIGGKMKLDLGVRINKKTGEEMEANSWTEDEVFEKKSEKEYTIVGITSSISMFGGGTISHACTYMDSGFLKDNRSYNIYVKLNFTKDAHEKLVKIAESAGLPVVNKDSEGIAKYGIEANEQLLRLYAQSISPTTNEGVILTLIFLIILIIVSTIAVIYNSFHISVLERISQFGILRCTGASPNQIRNIVFKEAAVLSFIGIPIGLFSGILAMEIVMTIIGRFKYNFFEGINVVISPYIFILGILLGIVTVFLSAFGPARQAGKVSPLEAVRSSGSFKKEKIKKVKKSTFAKVIFGIEGQLAYKNLRRNRKRFRITVFSMVISIVLYIVFGSFVDSAFKMDISQGSNNPDFTLYRHFSNNEGMDFSVYNEIKTLEGVDKVYKVMRDNVEILVPEDKYNKKANEITGNSEPEKVDGLSLIINNDVISYGNENLEELNKYLKEGKIDRDELDKENGVILIKTGKLRKYGENGKFSKPVLIDVLDAKVGDTLKLTTDYRIFDKKKPEDIKYNEVKVMAILEKGIFYDEYNQNGGVILITTEEVFSKIKGTDAINDSMFITLKDGADKEIVSDYLKKLKENDFRYNYEDFAEIAKQDRQAAISISIFLYGFVAVITLIGCLNIINTISTNLILRTRELSMLKAVGMSKGAVEKMICFEGIFYGLMAAIYGGIIGTGLSYVLFKFMFNISEFSFILPIKHIITAVIGAIIVALISGIIPLRKISKGSIIDNIRMEE